MREQKEIYMRIGAVLTLAAAYLLTQPQFALCETISPSITINTSGSASVSNQEVFTGLKLSMLLSAMVFIPTLLMTVTCFPRIAIVLALTRQALGTAQTPPNQIITGLSLFLTFAIMSPVFSDIYQNAITPYTEDQISHEEAFARGFKPLRNFMLPFTREQDISLFLEITKTPAPESPEELGPTILIPAFIISELNTAFQIAFLIYLPFLVLDMITSSVLTSMSMITLPPTVISLPLKLMLFVIIDGWGLIIGNIVKSFHL